MKKQVLALSATLIGLGALAAAGGASGLFPSDQTTTSADWGVVQPEGSFPMVRTLVLSDSPTLQHRRFFGQIRARETVDLALEVGGTLERLIPEEGQRVARGERLGHLRLDAFERAVARADLQLEQAVRDAVRTSDLAARGTAPSTRAEDAETARDLAEVALRDARAAFEDATLTAPFDGLVAARLVAAHSSVAPGQPVLRLHDMSQVRVEISVPERLAASAGALDAVTFAAALPDGNVPLTLVAFQPEAARVGQSFRLVLAFPKGQAAYLMPGASMTVIASLPAPAAGMTVPTEAVLVQNDRSTVVFVVEGATDSLRVRQVAVTVASANGTSLQIEGIPPGAEIVTVGVHRLQDGQRVRRSAPLTVVES